MFSSVSRCLSFTARLKRRKLAARNADRRRLLVEPLESRRVLAALAIGSLDAIKAEGNSGSTPFTFTVSRDTTTATSSVNFAVTGSGANPATANDFAGGAFPTGTVNFAVGEASKTVTINVAGDTLFEPNEGFTVTLSNASAGDTISTATAQGQINNDDTATISIAAASADKAEGSIGSTAFTFTVTRTGIVSGTSSVQFAVTGSGANPASGADFVGGGLPMGTVTFAANETTKTINIIVVGDADPEPTEGFTVTLSNVGSGDSIGTATAVGRIQNDDGTVGIATLAISALSADKPEGNIGTTAFTFRVTRGGDLNHATSVQFAVTGSGANPASGADFSGGSLPTGTVNFAVGETSKTITVSVVGDTDAEFSEGFTVTLSNASPPDSINTASATGTIQNDDGGVTPATLAIAAASANKPEGSGSNSFFTFTITRGGDLDHVSSVDVTVTGSGVNPASGADFNGGAFPSGTVVFAVGESSQTITITVVGDTVPESDESFTVTLSNPSSPDTITTASATGTIRNDDTVPGATLAIAATDAAKAEGNSGGTAFTFTVTRGGITTGASTVNFAVTGSGASPAGATDFVGGVLPSGSVNFAAGETSKVITVNVSGDTAVEASETFTVTLSGAAAPDTITTATAIGSIQADDPPGSGLGVATSNVPRGPRTAVVAADLDNPGQSALIVTGTSANDVIVVEPTPGQPSQIRVRHNGVVIGNFDVSSVQTIVVFGRAGNDTITINSQLSIDALLFGEAGNDRLTGALGEDGLDGGAGLDFLSGLGADDELEGGPDADELHGGLGNDQLLGNGGNDFLHGEGGHDILLGSEGNDSLFGLDGRDLLIGGGGSDVLQGGLDDDLLIGGSTTHAANQSALLAILAELQASSSYLVRVNNLRLGGGANGSVVLDSSTIINDGIADRLWGGGHQDWFITGPGDQLRDRAANELVN